MNTQSGCKKADRLIDKLRGENTITAMCAFSICSSTGFWSGVFRTSGELYEFLESGVYTSAHVNSAIKYLEKEKVIVAIRYNGRTYFTPLICEEWQRYFWTWFSIPF